MHCAGINAPQRTWMNVFISGIILCAFLVYGVSLSHDFVQWDDPSLVLENPHIRSFSLSHLKAIFTTYDPELYIPLTFFSYQLDYVLWGGLNSFGFHLTNLLLHIANALLVFLFILTLLTSSSPSPPSQARVLQYSSIPVFPFLSPPLLPRQVWIALLTSLLFLLHPLHTEAVVWVSARKDVLSSFFTLASLAAYLKYLKGKKSIPYFLSIALCFLGLLSKMTVVTLPLILLLIDFKERRPLTSQTLYEKIPYFLLSLAFSIIAIFGKLSIIDNALLTEKILMAGKSTVFYLQKLVVPTGLSVLYPYTDPITLASPDFLLPWIVLLLLGATLLIFANNRDIVFGSLFFLIILAPTYLNFAKAGEVYVASDRYAYLPSIGIFFLTAAGLFSLHKRIQDSTSAWRKLLVPLGTLSLLILLALASFRQSLTWRNTEALFQNVLRHYPTSFLAYDYLGNTFTQQMRHEEALAAYTSAITLRPDSARLYSNLGALYAQMRMPQEEYESYAMGVRRDPQYVPLRYNLALALRDQGKTDEALAQYQMVMNLDPDFFDARLKYAQLLLTKGERERAELLFLQELLRNPEEPRAITGLQHIRNSNQSSTSKRMNE